MSGKVFFDTNIPVYAWSQDEPAKQQRAASLLADAMRLRRGVVSTQVLQEFYTVAAGKLRLPATAARAGVEHLAAFHVVGVDIDSVREAIDLSILEQLSLWDALIIIAAAKARCTVLYSEDLADGRTYRGVRVVNPFLD